MHLKPDSPRRANEERRYFPDWTVRLEGLRDEVEADHNSYLAGGYAEEFGYRAQPGFSRGVPVIDGELPDESAEWRVQAGVTHPGYPITPRPVALDGELTEAVVTEVLRRQRNVASHEPPVAAAREMELHGTFVRVTDRRTNTSVTMPSNVQRPCSRACLRACLRFGGGCRTGAGSRHSGNSNERSDLCAGPHQCRTEEAASASTPFNVSIPTGFSRCRLKPASRVR